MNTTLRLTIFLISFSMATLVAQDMTYAEELLPDQPYPYKDYPPSQERVRLFSLIHNYLLKDDPLTMMPSSNIIDLSESSLEGSTFKLVLSEGWRFQSNQSSLSREVSPYDVSYSISQASIFLNTLSDYGISEKTLQVKGDHLFLKSNKQLFEADSIEICNALRRVILVPDGSGDDVSQYKKSPSGAGPFYEVEKSLSSMQLSSEDTEDYIEGNPKLETINIIQVPIRMNHTTKFKSEKTDILINANIFNKDLCEEKEYKCKSIASDILNLLYLNHRNSKMRTKDFRLALDLGINKEQLVEDYEATALNGPLSSRNAFYSNRITSRDYDPDRSIEILESLGYEYVNDMFIDPSTQENLTVRLMYNKKSNAADIIDAIASNLDDIGITVKRLSYSNLKIQKVLKKKTDTWDMYLLLMPMEARQFVRPYYYSKLDGQANKNFGGYKNKSIDKLFNQFQNGDGTQRSKLGPQIHRMLYDDIAVIGLFTSDTWAIYHKHVTPYIKPYYFFDQPYKWKSNSDK